MSRPGPFPAPTDETDRLDGWERALLDRQVEALGRLADMGMALAAAIQQRAVAQEEPASDAVLRNAAMDFARVSRAVRMTFALQSRLIADFKSRPEARPGKAEEPAEGGFEIICGRRSFGGLVAQREMRGLVRRVARAAGLDGEALEQLQREAAERLEDEDFHEILMSRPTGEVLALICADLGLEPDWDQLSQDPWAKAEIDRSPPGSPFAGWKARKAQEAQGAQASPTSFVPSG